MTPVLSALLSVALFCIGLFGVMTRRDIVALLASVEVMLGSANLAVVTFGSPGRVADAAEGLGLVVLVIAAAEAAVGLALLLAAARRSGRTRVDDLMEVEG